jgi:cellobiose transport system substrate-binding protein
MSAPREGPELRRQTTRRDFLRVLSGAAGGVGLAGLAGCGVFGSPENRADKTTLWYWDRSINDDFLANADKHVAGLHLQPNKIGINYRTKLLTTLAGHAFAPDISNINADIATYFPDDSAFVDLYTLGARDLKDQYLDWKWELGVTPTGKMLGFPIDTGPTALMYRTDVFKKAGLPTDPDKVAPMAASWDGYLELGTRLRKVPKTFLVANIGDIFGRAMAQSAQQYMTKSGKFIGDQAHVKSAWDYAVKAHRFGVTSRTPDGTPDWNAGLISGSIATVDNAVWEAFVIQQTAPATSGKWRVCPGPGGAGNSGGSFMAITKYCRNPKLAFEAIKWLQSPSNQTKAYTTIQLFPSALSSLSDPAIDKTPNKFFGGQPIGEIFSAAAKAIKPAYNSAYDNLISTPYTTELLNVESAGKDPNKGWEDAVSEAKRQLRHVGVAV